MTKEHINLLFVSGGFPKKGHFMKDSIDKLGYVNIDSTYRWNHEVTYYEDRRNLVEKISEKVGFPIDFHGANRRIIEQVSKKRYDIIFVVKGNHIYPNTLNRVSKLSPKTKLVNWSHDNMFEEHNRSRFYAMNLEKYDLVVTTKSFNLDPDQLPSLGAKRILFQNNSCFPYPYLNDLRRPERFKYDVIFIGSAEKERFESLNYLAKHGIKIKIFGSGWDKKVYGDIHSNLDIEYRDLLEKDYFKAMLDSKISLSFLRKINKDLQTLRTVEIPFCGAFMITEDTEEQNAMFEKDKEAVFFGSNIELLKKVRFYLKHENKREQIARNGMLKARNMFNMIDNAEEIIQSVSKL